MEMIPSSIFSKDWLCSVCMTKWPISAAYVYYNHSNSQQCGLQTTAINDDTKSRLYLKGVPDVVETKEILLFVKESQRMMLELV